MLLVFCRLGSRQTAERRSRNDNVCVAAVVCCGVVIIKCQLERIALFMHAEASSRCIMKTLKRISICHEAGKMALPWLWRQRCCTDRMKHCWNSLIGDKSRFNDVVWQWTLGASQQFPTNPVSFVSIFSHVRRWSPEFGSNEGRNIFDLLEFLLVFPHQLSGTSSSTSLC